MKPSAFENIPAEFIALQKLFRKSNCIGILFISRQGEIIYSNALFNKLIRKSKFRFINPGFNSIINLKGKGVVFEGYITLGRKDINDESYNGVIYKINDVTAVKIELNLEGIDFVSTKLSQLIQENSNLQRQLIKEKKIIELNFEQIKNLNDEKTRFLGIAAHDLRNPIGTARNFADLLLRNVTCNSDDSGIVKLNIIKERCNFSLHLLNELLDVTAIESGQLILKKSKTNLNHLILKTIGLNMLFAEKKDIQITHSIETEITLECDPNKIEQVVNNLIGNAIKYSANNTEIKVHVLKNPSFAEIIVEDQGPGIPEEDLTNLFKPFSKTQNRPIGEGESTGLGLAISKRIINDHGGIIGVKNNNDKGASFYFTLPI